MATYGDKEFIRVGDGWGAIFIPAYGNYYITEIPWDVLNVYKFVRQTFGIFSWRVYEIPKLFIVEELLCVLPQTVRRRLPFFIRDCKGKEEEIYYAHI